MKIAFIYAGQGSQFEKMGQDLYENQPVFKQTLDQIDEKVKVKDLCFNADIETLSQTKNTQPCMVAFALAITKTLKSYGIEPTMTAGLSLGEYSALNCAGVLNDIQAVKLVSFRALEMTKASDGVECSMWAIMGFDREKLIECCQKVQDIGYVTIANYNSPVQQVISGQKEACKKVSEMVIELGAKRAVELNVSGPFHTKYMKPAGDALKEKFNDEQFLDMKIPVVFNSLGTQKNADQDIKELLVSQVQSSVYFEDSIKHMIEQGVDTFVEIGGGKVLSAFIKKIKKDISVFSVYDVKTLEETLNKLEGEIAC